MAMIVATCGLATGLRIGAAPPPDAAPRRAADDLAAIDGFWSGTWGGGGGADGVVMQPFLAELLVQGNRIKTFGLRGAERASGTVRLDPAAGRLTITVHDEKGQPTTQRVEFSYELLGNELTLVDRDNVRMSLRRVASRRLVSAVAQVELLVGCQIDDAGNLIVSDVSALRATNGDARLLESQRRALVTRDSLILLVRDEGCQEISIDEARRLTGEATPVAIAFRREGTAQQYQPHTLVKRLGTPSPDDEAARRTFARTLRQGTLVFLLSEQANVPVP